MEFRFRAGDEKDSSSSSSSSWLPPPSFPTSFSCDGYFTAQAMRAGLLGGGAGGFPTRMPIPPMGAFEREMRKERIREEILREEVERRVIEEEVRRELEMELAMARRLHGAAAMASDSPFMASMPFDEFKNFRDGFWCGGGGIGGAVGRRPSLFFGERLLLEGPRGASEEKKPPLTRPKLELREIEPSGSSEGPQVEPKASGMKRKADEIVPASTLPKLQKPAQDWSCALCQVSATSEAGLNEHLEGKKHKAKLTQCGAIKPTTKDKSGLKTITGNKVSNGPDDVPKKISIQVDGAMHEVVQKNNYLWCERCRVRCDNNVTMAGHLRGKKHRDSSKIWKPIKAARMISKSKEEPTAEAENEVNENDKKTAADAEENKEGGEESGAFVDVELPAPED